MLQLQYQFSPEDALRYYETLLSSSHQTRLPRGIALLWGPALCAALMIGFQWTHSIGAWVIAVSFSLLWLFYLAPRFFRNLCRSAAKRKLASSQLNWEALQIEENEGCFRVNETEKKLADYFILKDFLIVAFEDQTQLVIPEQAFGENEERMKQWLLRLSLAVNRKQTKKQEEKEEIVE